MRGNSGTGPFVYSLGLLLNGPVGKEKVSSQLEEFHVIEDLLAIPAKVRGTVLKCERALLINMANVG
jgi:hypothetical protein